MSALYEKGQIVRIVAPDEYKAKHTTWLKEMDAYIGTYVSIVSASFDTRDELWKYTVADATDMILYVFLEEWLAPGPKLIKDIYSLDLPCLEDVEVW